MVSEEDIARGRSYLAAQSQKLGLLEIWPRIAGRRLEILQEVGDLTEAQARWSPAPGQWSAYDVARHLVAWTDGVLAVCRALADGGDPPDLVLGDLGEVEYATFEEARAALIRTAVNVAAFMTVEESLLDLARTHPHPLFGPLDVKGWLLFIPLHGADHLAQLRAIRHAPGFPAT